LRISAANKLSSKSHRRSCLSLFCVLLQACSNPQSETTTNSSETVLSNWSDIVGQIDWPETNNSLEIPEDVRLHPEAAFESFISKIVLHGPGDELQGVLIEMDRISFPGSSQIDSDWSYQSVVRSHIVRSESKYKEPWVKDEFARLALGLSESDQTTLSVSNIGVALEHPGRCDSTLTLTGSFVERPVTFSVQLNDCPVASDLGSLKQWEYPVLRLVGQMDGKQVEGHAWIVHRWGTPTSIDGPVVVDELKLRILEEDNVPAQLTITRTKRRSGRGPMSVFATHQKLGEIKALVDVSWTDEFTQAPQAGTFNYPSRIRLQLNNQQELIVDPVVTGSEQTDEFVATWSSAARVSGSFDGIGYLDFQPLRTHR